MSKEMNYLYIPACPDAIAQAWHLCTRSLFFPMYFQLQQRGYNYSDRVISTMTVSVLTFWVIKPKTPNTNCFRDNLKSIKFGRCRWNSKELRKKTNKKRTTKIHWAGPHSCVLWLRGKKKEKRAMLVKKDGWLVTRGVRAGQRILRQWQTHKHTTTT